LVTGAIVLFLCGVFAVKLHDLTRWADWLVFSVTFGVWVVAGVTFRFVRKEGKNTPKVEKPKAERSMAPPVRSLTEEQKRIRETKEWDISPNGPRPGL
jgi:hypothetical protein